MDDAEAIDVKTFFYVFKNSFQVFGVFNIFPTFKK